MGDLFFSILLYHWKIFSKGKTVKMRRGKKVDPHFLSLLMPDTFLWAWFTIIDGWCGYGVSEVERKLRDMNNSSSWTFLWFNSILWRFFLLHLVIGTLKTKAHPTPPPPFLSFPGKGFDMSYGMEIFRGFSRNFTTAIDELVVGRELVATQSNRFLIHPIIQTLRNKLPINSGRNSRKEF